MDKFIWRYGEGNELRVFEEIFDKDNNNRDDEETDKPSEYLFEMHLSKLLRNAVVSNNYILEGKLINLEYETLQTFFAYSKGILASVDNSVDEETDNRELRDRVFDFISKCRRIWNNSFRDKSKNENINNVSFDDYFDNDSVVSYLKERGFKDEINAIANYCKETDNKYPPYYLFERLVIKTSPLMSRRRNLVKVIKRVVPSCVLQSNNNLLICQMVLNDTEYSKFANVAKTEVINYTEGTINKYLSSSSINDKSFKISIEQMRKCINSCDKGGNSNFSDYKGKKKSCFSVFEMPSDKYVSLSGPFDVTDPIILNYFAFTSSKKQSNKDRMNKINNIIMSDWYFCNSKYANLNLYTKRFLCSESNTVNTLGETVDDAIKVRVAPKTIMGDYACCERKIFSSIIGKISGDCYLFTRREPCEKCRPAIKEVLNNKSCNLRIFYSDNDIVKEFDMSTL